MARLIAQEFISLDGVAQSPSYPDEDTDGDFRRGGWHTEFFDDTSMAWVVENVTAAGSYLLGRRTYEIFAAHWPAATDEEQAVARPLNERSKYVVSTTLAEPLDWQNSHLLQGDVAEAVTSLKAGQEEDIHLIGSTQLVQTLIRRSLVDEFRLMIDPIILGAGKRIFPDSEVVSSLQLVDSRVTSTGALLARYARRSASQTAV